jgi:hypothetical protein
VSKDAPRPIRLPTAVWRQDDVLAFCRSQDADALFRLARRYGHSNESIAYWTGIDPAEVSKRITGGKGPVRTLDRWLRIAEALDMPDEARQILGLASRRRDSATSAAPLVAGDLSTSYHPVLFGVRQGAASPSAVDPCLPRTLLDLLVHYAQTDNMLGPRSLLLAATSQLTLIEQLWTVARGPLRSELLGVGARYAEFAGWLHQDVGDHTTGAAGRFRRWTSPMRPGRRFSRPTRSCGVATRRPASATVPEPWDWLQQRSTSLKRATRCCGRWRSGSGPEGTRSRGVSKIASVRLTKLGSRRRSARPIRTRQSEISRVTAR